MPDNLIHFMGPQDLVWPMGMQDSVPQYSIGIRKHPRTVKVDPYPAYPHDLQLVEDTLNHCQRVFPLTCHRFGLWVLSHDLVDRVNGLTYEDNIWSRDDGSEWDETINGKRFYGQAISIVLAGKRIPIMPSMTRYLVSHEYGHGVFNCVARLMGYKDHEYDGLQAEYMNLRGIDTYQTQYGGGSWHLSPGEIMANDFRILFTKQEMEFYPHGDVPLPNWNEPEGKWWKEAKKICGVE